ncbi:hypothetical protein HQ533_05365 [Candidatus Woesearchaeota archaeon]|nr:hypothetical protein [Candidatus Woesearchaeota archaeon]
MGVDNIFIIKTPDSLFRVLRGVFEKNNLEKAEDFAPYILYSSKSKRENERLMEYLELIINNANDDKKSGRMRKHELFEKTLFEKISEERDFFKGRIVIPINGLSVDEYGRRDGLDPYSPEFRFSSRALSLQNHYDHEFLKTVPLFMYMQPATFTQMFKEWNGGLRLEDLLSQDLKEFTYEERYKKKFQNDFPEELRYQEQQELEEVVLNEFEEMPFQPSILELIHEPEQEYDPFIETVGSIGFGSLTKPSDMLVGSLRYREILFDLRPIKRAIEKSPSTFEKDVLRTEKFSSVKDFLRHHSRRIHIAKTLMAIKWGFYFQMLEENLKEMIDEYNLRGIPLYMEKTSATSDIIKQAIKFSGTNLPIQYIGGFEGIVAGKLVVDGIHSEPAFRRLSGFLSSTQSIWKGDYSRTRVRASKPDTTLVKYESSEKIPWVKLEESIHGRHPNMEDMVEALMIEREQAIVDRYSRRTQSGVCRIEPRLVELKNYKGVIIDGRASETKVLLEWQKEIEGKEWILDLKAENYFGDKATFLEEQDPDNDVESDFRGSEFSPPVNCSIEKVISRAMKENGFELIKRITTDEQKRDFYRFFDPELKEPIAALRGTKLHEVGLQPFPSLVHYETLRQIGIEPMPSSNYCEILFQDTLFNPRTENNFSISFHPDTLFFMKDQNDVYDVVVIDKKTNREISYPETYYTKQIAFYGLMVKKFLEENGYKTGNTYLILDKNAFNDQFVVKGEELPPFHNINVFRPQKYERIMRFTPKSTFPDSVMEEVYKIVAEKDILMSNDWAYFVEMRERMEISKGKSCKNCFFEKQVICDKVIEKNIGLMDVLEGNFESV